MKEVEIFVKVNNSKDEALEILHAQSLHFEGVKVVHDVYFYDPLRDMLKPTSSGGLKESFRLRKKDEKAYLTYKVDYFQGEKWLYSSEHEISVSSYEEALNIVIHLGLNKLVEIHNEKHTFTTNNYEIVLEDVRDLGIFLEVERFHVGDDESIEVVKQEIQAFIDSLGLDVSLELNKGKPELMLEMKKAKG